MLDGSLSRCVARPGKDESEVVTDGGEDGIGCVAGEPKTLQNLGRFSNRSVGVKHFQTIHYCSVDVARGLVLLFGIGTKALPSWDSKTRRNNLWGGLAV